MSAARLGSSEYRTPGWWAAVLTAAGRTRPGPCRLWCRNSATLHRRFGCRWGSVSYSETDLWFLVFDLWAFELDHRSLINKQAKIKVQRSDWSAKQSPAY